MSKEGFLARLFSSTGPIARFFPNADSTFAYTTQRSLTIKDWRLGVLSLLLQTGIFMYIVVYQVMFQQAYRRESNISASLRTRTLQGAPEYRWINGTAPFCLGVTTFTHTSAELTSRYTTPDASTYTYTPPGGQLRTFPRRACTFLDEGDAVPLQESDRAFLLTEARITPQTWSAVPCTSLPCNACPPPNNVSLTNPLCAYQPANNNANSTVTQRYYVPDIEFFTLNIDHSVVAPQAGIARTATEMVGALLDGNGDPISPCLGYTSLGLPCPRVVSVGRPGTPDIVPLRTLMLAAGLDSLDVLSESDTGPNPGDPVTQVSSMRQQGLVLIIDIYYTNFALGSVPSPRGDGAPMLGGVGQAYLFTPEEVQYTYRVFAVPETQFQFQLATANQPPLGAPPDTVAPVRFFRRDYGVRLLITYNGRIGNWNTQTLLINLVAAVALLGASAVVLEFVAFSICPLRSMYRQMKDRETVSITELRRAGRKDPKDYAAMVEAFNSAKENTLEKQPEEVLKVLRGAEAEDVASKGSIEMSQVNALHTAQWAGTGSAASAGVASAGAVAWK